MKRLLSLLVSGALLAGSGGIALAQQNGTTDAVKHGAKDVGKGTKEVAKGTAKTVKKTTKKTVHKSAEATSKGAKKVEDKTNPTK